MPNLGTTNQHTRRVAYPILGEASTMLSELARRPGNAPDRDVSLRNAARGAPAAVNKSMKRRSKQGVSGAAPLHLNSTLRAGIQWILADVGGKCPRPNPFVIGRMQAIMDDTRHVAKCFRKAAVVGSNPTIGFRSKSRHPRGHHIRTCARPFVCFLSVALRVRLPERGLLWLPVAERLRGQLSFKGRD